jgi:eukaryotic-like serine/threonine-protein kinase
MADFLNCQAIPLCSFFDSLYNLTLRQNHPQGQCMNIRELAGVQIDEYHLKSIIGEGGMSAVYRAYQEELDRNVAIKVLSDKLSADPNYIKRFQQEARTAASLEHVHIVPVYDYGVYEGMSYVVMRLLGDNLSQRLHGSQPISMNDVIPMVEQIARALDYAHSRGIVHRDVKPSNIMFDDSGTAYLVDFGIAKAMQGDSGLTMENMVMGTPPYMSPEQWRDEGVGAASDQYAFAVVVFQVLTGRLPFQAETAPQWMYKHINEKPPLATEFNPSLSPAVAEVLNRALHKDAKRRYPLVSNFSNALARAITNPSTAGDTQERKAVVSPAPAAQTVLRQPSVPVIKNTPAPMRVPLKTPVKPLPMPQQRRKGKKQLDSGILYIVGGGLIGLILIFVLLLIVVGVVSYFMQ